MRVVDISSAAPHALPFSKIAERLGNICANTGCAQYEPARESFWVRASDDPIAVLTAILTFATIVLAIFTALLWRSTRKAVGDAAASAERQGTEMARSIAEAARAAAAMEGVAKSMAVNVRATISVLIGTASYQDRALKFETTPIVLNTGQTPALGLRYRIRAAILPVPLPSDFKFPLPADMKGYNVLGAGRDGGMPAVVADRIDEDRVEQTKWGDGQSLYVRGAIRYRDIFGRLHRCTFAQQIYWVSTGEMDQNWNVPLGVRGWHLGKHNWTN